MGVYGWFVGGQEHFIEDWMDLLPHSREFEMIRHKSLFSEDFKGSILFLSQLLAGSCRSDVGSFQPDFVSFVVIVSICSLFVIKCLHCFGYLGECGLCFGLGLCEVVNEILSCLAFGFVMGFKSLVMVSSVVEEEQ